MPEGDSVLRVARRLDAGLSGLILRHSDFRVPRHATVQLAGRRVEDTVSRGKHLLTRVEGGVTVHTHLRMDGEWTVLGPGRSLPPRLRPDVRVELGTELADGTPGPTAVALRMPVVDVLRTARRLLTFSVSATGAAQVTTGDTRRGRQHWVSGRAGRPCLRCGTTVLVEAEVPGDPERRRTWWCPQCQPAPAVPSDHTSRGAAPR